MEIAIIGSGKVGKSIGTGLLKSGNKVVYGSRNPAQATVPEGAAKASVEEAAKKAEVIFLAVPYSAVKETIAKLKNAGIAGKTVVDVTNIIGPNMEWAMGFNSSGAEELAKELQGVDVVKAFNTVFAEHMSTGKLNGEKLSLFMAGDNPAAKGKVKQLAEQIGFEACDAGELKNARYLEPLGLLMINLGFGMKMGTRIGFKLVKE